MCLCVSVHMRVPSVGGPIAEMNFYGLICLIAIASRMQLGVHAFCNVGHTMLWMVGGSGVSPCRKHARQCSPLLGFISSFCVSTFPLCALGWSGRMLAKKRVAWLVSQRRPPIFLIEDKMLYFIIFLLLYLERLREDTPSPEEQPRTWMCPSI